MNKMYIMHRYVWDYKNILFYALSLLIQSSQIEEKISCLPEKIFPIIKIIRKLGQSSHDLSHDQKAIWSEPFGDMPNVENVNELND